ncbi:MAG: ABC transporter permease, partial [Planctomycetota bacterium]
MPYARGLDLFRDAHVQPLYWAKLADNAIYQDVRERWKASFVIEKPKGSLAGERVDQRAFRKSVRMAAFLSLLLGLFVIYNAFSLSLVERVREIGLLRAIGLTGKEIAASVLME